MPTVSKRLAILFQNLLVKSKEEKPTNEEFKTERETVQYEYKLSSFWYDIS